MSKEEKIREITRILHVHERNSKADLAKKIVDAMEEAPREYTGYADKFHKPIHEKVCTRNRLSLCVTGSIVCCLFR